MRKCVLACLGAAILFSFPGIAQKSTPAASALNGKEVFDSNCFMCHQVVNAKDQPCGKSLKGLFQRPTLSANGKPVKDANVREVIVKGHKKPIPNCKLVGGMPDFSDLLTDAEIDALVAYLKKV